MSEYYLEMRSIIVPDLSSAELDEHCGYVRIRTAGMGHEYVSKRVVTCKHRLLLSVHMSLIDDDSSHSTTFTSYRTHVHKL